MKRSGVYKLRIWPMVPYLTSDSGIKLAKDDEDTLFSSSLTMLDMTITLPSRLCYCASRLDPSYQEKVTGVAI